jgi:oligopeptide/dipeptide ABC transporter ATP-binding protein
MNPVDPILKVTDLRVRFETADGTVRAVDGVDFEIGRDETVALVGESGCGKSVASLALARLVAGPGLNLGGSVVLMGRDVLAMPERQVRDLRGAGIAYIFQDPAASLNPVKTIGSQIAEAIRLHRREADADAETAELLTRVGLPAGGGYARAYPHQFSGGMQQRAMIAMALACRPQLLVADEPTTALDVTIQAQIFRLLDDLRRQFRMAVLLITHNLGLVAQNASRVYVMYAGRIMETGPVAGVLRRPAHPYTKGLLAAVPRLARATERMVGIEGTVPHPARLPSGCRFHPRCRMAEDACRAGEPGLQTVTEGQSSRCHFWKRIV